MATGGLASVEPIATTRPHLRDGTQVLEDMRSMMEAAGQRFKTKQRVVLLANRLASELGDDRLNGFLTTLRSGSATFVFFDIPTFDTLWISREHLFYVGANDALLWHVRREDVQDVTNNGYSVAIRVRGGICSLSFGGDSFYGTTSTPNQSALRTADRVHARLSVWWTQLR